MRITLSGVKCRVEPSMWLLELDAVFVDGAQRGEREDLESTRVGEDRAVPVHELVQAAHLADDLVAGPQVQVIGVGEDHLRAHRARSSGSSAFTVASVPTGMKAGVSTAPCGVVNTPVRAEPTVS